MEFYQDGPQLENTFINDSYLQFELSRWLSPEALLKTKVHLEQVGAKAAGEWLNWSQTAEAHQPTLVQFDPWGKRVGEIHMNEAWNKLVAAASSEGIVASGYERKYGEYSRVYQAALLYLFHPSSAFVSCPLAMTDGAARAIELFGDDEMKKCAFRHLTSRDPKEFWTSGQWMTERSGGSDVSSTSTVARKNGTQGSGWSLYGTKWFTSATTSQMAMLLARPEGAEDGSRGLSLFYTETLKARGGLRDEIEILRLKDKLGTRAMPTAELKLDGLPARLVGDEGGGVRKISSLFNITRVYNSICAVGHLRRALDLAQSYSRKRRAFGKLLIDHPLHRATLEDLEKEFRKCLSLAFYVAHLLGKDECGTASDEERILLRALTPIVKLFTARKCMLGVSEVIECFGGAGYIEDTGLPKMLRDAQVFSIWEGTTNVLALDFLRALDKEKAGPILMKKVDRDFAQELQAPAAQAWQEVQKILSHGAGQASLEGQARKLAFQVAEVFAAGLEQHRKI